MEGSIDYEAWLVKRLASSPEYAAVFLKECLTPEGNHLHDDQKIIHWALYHIAKAYDVSCVSPP